MKYALSPLAFTLGASAAVLKRSDCCFELTASGSGDVSGTLGQLNDGQNRVGGDYPAAKYCINQSGAITDSNGRGCILTPPTTQFQCDEGASPTTGFSIGNGGDVTYNGSTQFYACPAADGEYNIYTKPVEGQDKCVEITLSTDGKCASGSTPAASTPVASTPVPVASTPGDVTSTLTQYTTECSTTGSTPAPSAPVPVSSAPPAETTPAGPTPSNTQPAPESPPASSIQSVTVPASSASTPVASQPQPSTPAATPPTTPSSSGSSACPTNLDGDYQYPHLIVPVNSTAPSDSYGTQYNGEISESVCSLFNFDIPADWSAGTCSVLFLLPQKEELETSNYTLSGSGGEAVFKELSAPADETTTWDSVPEAKGELGSWALEAGKRFVVQSVECSAIADQTLGYEVCAQGGLELEWFQDWNPSPIGLFVRKC